MSSLAELPKLVTLSGVPEGNGVEGRDGTSPNDGAPRNRKSTPSAPSTSALRASARDDITQRSAQDHWPIYDTPARLPKQLLEALTHFTES